MRLIINIPKEVYKNIQSKSTEIQAKGYTLENAVLNGIPFEKLRSEIEHNIGDNLYKNDGIYCSLHVLDNYMMPCITEKELQHCREVVKKYAPKVKAGK